MSNTATGVNGVNVTQLVDTINAIKDEPSIADFKFHATTTWISGGHCQTKIQNFTGANSVDQISELVSYVNNFITSIELISNF